MCWCPPGKGRIIPSSIFLKPLNKQRRQDINLILKAIQGRQDTILQYAVFHIVLEADIGYLRLLHVVAGVMKIVALVRG
jgi:hypothetical protein